MNDGHEPASPPDRFVSSRADGPPRPRRDRPIPRREDAATAPRPEGASLYLFGARRRPLLTREGEVELARRVEEGERATLKALARSKVALRELGAVGEELAARRLRLSDVLRASDNDDIAAETSLERLVAPLRRAGALGAQAQEEAAERRAVLAELDRIRLHRRILDRVARALSADATEANKSDRATLRAVEKGRRAADQAKTELVEANLPLVLSLARRYAGRGLPLHDLVQEGNLGLMRAVDKFDHRRGYRFSTYAAWWVDQQMARALADQARAIRVPMHLVETRTKVERARRAFAAEHGREPAEAELAERAGLPIAKVRSIGKIAPEPLSLDAPVGPGADILLGDLAPDRSAQPADETIARARMREQARELLSTLTPREQDVLRRRFGLEGGDQQTLAEIGASLSVSRERVRQIEAEALRKLRGPSRSRELESYLAD